MKKRVILYLLCSLLCASGFAQTSGDSIKISVRTNPGAEIGIDSEMSSTNILSKTVSCGKHKVIVTCGPTYKKEYEIDVTSDGNTSFEYDVKGSFTPSIKPKKATVYNDGVKISDKEGISTLGMHNMVGYGYPDLYEPTEATIVVKPEEQQDVIFAVNKKKPNLSGFVLANFMFRVNAPGVMVGIGRRFGGYAKFNIGVDGLPDDYVYGIWGDTPQPNNKFDFNEDVPVYKRNRFFDVCAGITYKPINIINIYLGAGYYEADHGNFYRADNSRGRMAVKNQSKGLLVDLGIIAKYRALLLQVGYSRGIALGDSFGSLGEFNIGIGVNIHKNKKK